LGQGAVVVGAVEADPNLEYYPHIFMPQGGICRGTLTAKIPGS